MGLRDHFRPPLSLRRHWHAFHNAWATFLASDLNQRLPEGYFAEPNVQFGIEIDVATFEEREAEAAPTPSWTPPRPALTVPFPIVTDCVEVAVYNAEAGPILAGALELVSPSNKDRPAHRAAFVSKCRAYLQQGIGLVIVDVVTARIANLHRELLEPFQVPDVPTRVAELYTTAYRPVEHEGQSSLDIWEEPLTLGTPLPTMPLWLPGALCMAVELNATYERTCREQRIPVEGEG